MPTTEAVPTNAVPTVVPAPEADSCTVDDCTVDAAAVGRPVDSCMGGQLLLLVTLEETRNAEMLARPMGIDWWRVPSLVRVVEDLVLWRTYTARRQQPHESHNSALAYTARQCEMLPRSVRYRIECLQRAAGQQHAPLDNLSATA